MAVMDILDGPDAWVAELGVNRAAFLLFEKARAIVDKTPLNRDAWDDLEEWQLVAIELSHGYLSLYKEIVKRGVFYDE